MALLFSGRKNHPGKSKRFLIISDLPISRCPSRFSNESINISGVR